MAYYEDVNFDSVNNYPANSYGRATFTFPSGLRNISIESVKLYMSGIVRNAWYEITTAGLGDQDGSVWVQWTWWENYAELTDINGSWVSGNVVTVTIAYPDAPNARMSACKISYYADSDTTPYLRYNGEILYRRDYTAANVNSSTSGVYYVTPTGFQVITGQPYDGNPNDYISVSLPYMYRAGVTYYVQIQGPALYRR